MRGELLKRRITDLSGWGMCVLVAIVPGSMLVAFLIWLTQRAYRAAVNCER